MDCFVQQLKAVDNNGGGEYFNAVTINCVSNANYVLNIVLQNSKPSRIILPEGAYLTQSDGVTPLTNITQNIYDIPASNEPITYYLSQLGVKYNAILTNCDTLVVLYSTTAVRVRLTGYIGYFINNKVLTTFGKDNFTNDTFDSGSDLSYICHNKTLSNVTLGNNKIQGNIEDMALAQWSAGRRDGNLFCSKAGSSLKLNGSLIGTNTSFYISYTDSQITVHLGNYPAPVAATYNSSTNTWTYAS